MAKILQGAKTGSVTATDLTFEMLSVAKRRAALLEYSNIRFAISTMEALPFADNSFDGATCRLGLMFPAEKTACAREARRVLKPGGRVAYLCWGTLAANPAFELFAGAMESYFEEEFPLRMVRYSLGEPGSIAAILEEAGFSDVREEIVSYEREIAPGDNYFRHGISRTWPESVKNFSDADWTSLLKHTEEVFSELRRGENFFIPNSANLGTGMADG